MWTPGYLSGTLSLLCVLTHHASSEQLACDSNAIPYPSYFGTEVTSLTANSVHDYDTTAFPDWLNIPFDRHPLDFCNITLTYTHPGLNDSINVYIWLPLSDWNGNFLAQGGGGWAAGMDGALAPAVGLKYAAANTDAGHTFMGDMIKTGFDSKWWSLVSPGNINLVLFQDFASTALDDMTHLAKSVVESFYGRKPRYSYWSGCSTGGRQGFMQAQRYPSVCTTFLTISGVHGFKGLASFADRLIAELRWHLSCRTSDQLGQLCDRGILGSDCDAERELLSSSLRTRSHHKGSHRGLR